MKKTAVVLLLLVLLAGCGAADAPVASDTPDWRGETPDWQVVSVDPEDFGISYADLEDLSGFSLDKLTAYCLGSDGIFAEEAFGELYHRFLEAPYTCVAYFALIQEEGALDTLCEHIALENALYAYVGRETSVSFTGYDEWPERFQSILEELNEAYPPGGEAKVAAALRLAHAEALEAMESWEGAGP